jgi:uncharacterized protein YggE
MGDVDEIPVVRVEGRASTTTLPDKAELRLQVSHLDADPKEALRVAGERAEEVTAVLRETGIPDTAWHTAGVRVAEEWRWEKDKSVSYGHRATARFDITVTEGLDVVGAIVSKSVAAGAEVVGQDLVVSPDNAGRQEAYRRAALDARARATAYTDALGLRLGRVVRIDEAGESRPTPMPRMMAMAAPADEAAPAGAATVHVGEIEVDAAVTITFALDG